MRRNLYGFSREANSWRAYTDLTAPFSADGEGNGDFALAASAGSSLVSAAPWASNIAGTYRLTLAAAAPANIAVMTSPDAVRFSGGAAEFICNTRWDALSTAADRFIARIGFFESSLAAEGADGVFFRYSHDVNGGDIQAVTRSNSLETVADTNVFPAAGALYFFRILINEDGTQALFYVNNLLAGTITANIPNTAGRFTGAGIGLARTANGSLATLAPITVDAIGAEKLLTTPRWK